MIEVNQKRSFKMQTTSETILLITVWTLTFCGLLFGTKAKLRKRKEQRKKEEQKEVVSEQLSVNSDQN
jgi:hypothetical protein